MRLDSQVSNDHPPVQQLPLGWVPHVKAAYRLLNATVYTMCKFELFEPLHHHSSCSSVVNTGQR